MRLARTCCAALLLIFASSVLASADEGPTFAGPLTQTEQQFVQSVRRDLLGRFPHVSDAVHAGYVQYTAADSSGGINYANQKWSSDPTHPSQLWYDRSGNLLGADFSVLRPNEQARPQLWGIDPGRWIELEGHVHYVSRDGSGALKYDQWIWNRDWVSAGGSLTSPSAVTLVKLGRVKSASNVVTVFEFPTIWDLVVWVAPNHKNPFSWD